MSGGGGGERVFARRRF